MHVWKHPNGTKVIECEAETPEDHSINLLLFGRYDGTGLIGSASGSGERMQLLVSPLTEAEIAANERTDAIISGWNSFGRAPTLPGGALYIEADAVAVA